VSKRIIIGEMERAGLPISAPVITPDRHTFHEFPPARWVQKGVDSQPSYFVLEAWNATTAEWQEVPCVIPLEHQTT